MIPLLIGAICGLVMIIISFGTYRSWPIRNAAPRVTVIVCARDEEETIFDCLISLATQSYPDDRYKLILVDHLSTDRTGEIMDMFAESSPMETIVLHIDEPDKEVRGKLHALSEAMKHVDTDYVLLTDADCVVPESWIRTLVSSFSKHVIAVGGMVSVGPEDDPPGGWVGKIQNVDHRYFMGLVGGLSGIAGYLQDRKDRRLGFSKATTFFHPTFVSGNNLAFRMSAYHAAGGFQAIGKSTIEDYELLTRMIKATKGHLAFTLEPEACIQTRPLTTLKLLWQQKRRWAMATSTFHLLSYVLYVIVFSCRVMLPWLIIWWPVEALLGLMLVALGSLTVLNRVNKLTGLHLRLRDIIFHEIYQIILNHALLLASIVRWPVIWKGERYPRKSR